LSVREILEPAICLAEDGYPVHPICAYSWEKGSFLLKDPKNIYGGDMLLNGKAPRVGEIMKMPLLANTFKELASGGKSSFYEGRIGEAIVSVVQEHGGVLSLDDLKNHTTTYDEPISVDYKGVRVWEMPPNGQGITALMALNILEAYDLKGMGHNSSQYLHTLIEALRLSFADTTWYCTDPSKVNVPIKELLSEKYAAERRKLIDGK
ncbi:glutathione hydrolase-like YwrD proenzyme, partial [Saccoglossus kowalevskii]|uniref:Gamma-glutamyltranspeptidase 3-like n=1 Tax=Saccoglossus kowalevskii TaxID=10224 RepID=A0ABM0MLN6_SACKO